MSGENIVSEDCLLLATYLGGYTNVYLTVLSLTLPVLLLIKLLWLPHIVMFYSCDSLFIYYVFLSCSIFESRIPQNLCQDVRMWFNVIHFEGQKSANFAPQLDDGVNLNSYNLKTRLQIEKTKTSVLDCVSF